MRTSTVIYHYSYYYINAIFSIKDRLRKWVDKKYIIVKEDIIKLIEIKSGKYTQLNE